MKVQNIKAEDPNKKFNTKNVTTLLKAKIEA